MSENPNPPVPEMDLDDSLGTKLLDREEDVSGSNIFALVIGINTYEGAKYKEFQLTGAVGDADDFQQYLLEDLRVPKEHITSLRDKGATRTAIIQGFRDLGSDQRIVQGQAIIIIYFAGHGAAADKPKEWLDWESPDDRIEMLCPSDMGLDGKKGLLTIISNAKGNNITLILDCCHSAGINRGGESNDDHAPNTRSRQVLQPPKVSPDCDSTIWSLAPTTQAVAGFVGTPRDSHVLLAACSRSQTAKEVDGKGLFTRALLKVMRERSMTRGELTYTSLMRCLIIPQQTPHLDGKHIHQKVFALRNNNADNPRIACRYEVGQTFLTLQAGSLLGITLDSIFHIYSTESGSGPYTTAVAKPVGTYISHLIPSAPGFFSQPSQPRVRWYYAQLVTLSGSNFATYCNDPNLLPTVLGDNRGPEFLLAVSTVLNPNEADLCLTVEEEKGHKMVFFDWGNQNRLLSAERTGLPSRSSGHRYDLSSDGISRIRNIINRYAHFTSHLDTLNPFPLTEFVSIEMKQLDENKQKMTGPDLLNGRDNEPIHITVDMSLPEDKRPCYGFTVCNISKVGLYVYLLYFDASTLQIDAWYNPKMGPDNMGEQDPQVDPCLSPNAKLHLGLGVAGVQPFSFEVPENQDVDICFFKFFVSDRPVDLGSIIQSPPPPELPATNRGAIQSKNPSPPPPPPILPDSWASRTISVIQKCKSAEQKRVTTRDPYDADISIHTAPSPSPSPLLPSVPVPGPLPGHTSTNHATDSQALARNVPPEPTQWWQWLLTWMRRPLEVCYAVIYAARGFFTAKRT